MNETLKKVKMLRPIDDIFFEKLIEDKGVCEEILRVILKDNHLDVLSVTPQSSIKNLYGRSVRLDAFCKLGSGSFCNIEVQKADDDNHAKRVRYNASCITANHTEVRVKFIKVPDVTMVYISAFDVFKQGKTIYHCRNVIEETNTPVDNGLREIYVNTAINDGSSIAELMGCFMQEQVENKNFPRLSKRVWYFKNDEGGCRDMCNLIEDYAKEVAEKAAEKAANETREVAYKENISSIRKLFADGVSLEPIIAAFGSISEEVIREIYKEVTGVKPHV